MIALAGVELKTIAFEPDAQTTRPLQCDRSLIIQCFDTLELITTVCV